MEKNYKKLCPFKGWVLENFPFIEADFDAITNYELLCKIIEYLNKTSSQFNDMIDNINYLNSWFENLDVQDEINNKLDEMVEDGTLQEIIADYLSSKAVFGFDNVQAMKEATNLIDGSYAKTLGYYTLNDGGSSLYKIRKVTNGDIVDEMFLIALSDDTLVAELIPLNNEINILQVGAKNDNSTDVGSIINKITNEYEYKVYIPSGTYKISETIVPKENSTINIDGNLNYTGNDTCIKITTGHNIISTKNITSNAKCITLENNTTDTKCTNNKIHLDGTIQTTNDHCIYLHSVLRGVCYNEISFDYLLAGTSYDCIYIKTEPTGSVQRYVNENVISGGTCGRGIYGVYIDTNTSGDNGEVNGMKFDHISFEGVTNGIYLNNARSNKFSCPRVAELSGHAVKFVGGCDSNVIEILSLLNPSKIDASETLENEFLNNFIYCEVSDSDGGRIGKDLLISNQRVKIRELISKFYYKNLTSGLGTNYTFGVNDCANYLLGSVDNATYTLNQYYGSKGINEIFLQTPNHVKIIDNYGNTVIDFTPTVSGTTEYIKCTCYNLNMTDTWICQKINKI